MTLTQVTKAGLHDIALDHVFTIGASGTDHYTFQGEGLNGTVNDPTLYLTRGKTYRFENGTGAHAIRIQSADNGTSGTLYNTGVTNNNTTGTVIVEVQHDAPDVLYYQCAAHANMKGTIYITGALADGTVTTTKLASSVNSAITANTAKTTNATHTGEVTGATALTISDDVVDEANLKVSNTPTDGYFLSAQSGNTGGLTWAQVAQPDLTNLSATNLTSGTVPDARFPATLPAVSGANLTNLPAATTTSGTNNFTVADGNLIIGTAGHGIDFSAQTTGGAPWTSSSAGNNVNAVEGELLDHYESGLWTPTIDYGITAGSMGASGRGDYTKVGNMVIIGFQWTRHGWTDMSLSSGDAAIKISGLPFTPKDTGATGVVNIPSLPYTGRTSNGQGGATVMIPPNSAWMEISGLSGSTPRFHLHAFFSVAY
tara:strand:- start:895 stop:2175 length:1281 start_codon:yes stop_codon:yes gene_type:complete